MNKLQTGQKFGKLTVQKWQPSSKTWLCLCDCGNTTQSRSWSLKTGKHKACSCSHKAARPERRQPNEIGIKKEIFRNYKRAAVKRGYSFELSLDFFIKLISSKCHYCGITDSMIAHSGGIKTRFFTKYNGIDRVDNSQGYTIENCVTACINCNNSKADLTLEEWKEWLSRVYNKTFND